ncbi:UNVERIFIED_CONTAM: hypothetical protein GTU68_011140, partial [Idotea baltica]|nr:hypothetical protein [Idotea baltica]
KRALKEARREIRPTDINEHVNATEQLITDLHVEVVNNLLKLNNLSSEDIDVIGFHGQTLLHGPEEGWSWQIGDGERLSRELGIMVVSDLRGFDVAHGGQGAPLLPVYHRSLFAGQNVKYPVGLINFGGVANITWIGGEGADDLIAFDTGPANALLDDWIRKNTDQIYDLDGKISAKGKVHQDLIDRWMNNDYFKLPPPKSLDRDDFNVDEVNALSLEDGAATLAAFSVECLKLAASQCPFTVKNWYVCGGGAHNPTIMAMLNTALGGNVEPVAAIGFDGDYIEAEGFAYMAVRKLYELPITFPGTTGISSPSTGGVLNTP